MCMQSRRQFLGLVGGLAALVLMESTPMAQTLASPVYAVERVPNPDQYRFLCDGLHFMSLVMEDEYGRINDFRPHPDAMPNDNAWGSSFYLMPFTPGATLKHTDLPTVTADSSGILVESSGGVSMGSDTEIGHWASSLHIQYDIPAHRITGNGTYEINLDNPLDQELNLFRIASNYLINVPLRDGTTGNTGDMQRANYYLHNPPHPDGSWIPIYGNHFPQDITDDLLIEMIGNFNNVDVPGVEPAYKPNITVRITSIPPQSGIPMIFGGWYDQSQSQNPYSDNVGITPLILNRGIPPNLTQLRYMLDFESTPYRGASGIILR